MTTKPLNEEELAALRKFDTPTICNILELVAPERRGIGYTTRYLHCVFPSLPPMVGYARTATVRAKEPSAVKGEAYRNLRFSYFDYVGSGPNPRISIIQDLDDGQPGYGSFWGEVNSNVHKALGCLGVVTNGSVRDLDMIADNFQLLAGVIAPSHAFIHLVNFDCEVSIHGMVVNSGDLVHADRHGAVVIPHEVARDIPKASEKLIAREAVIIAAAKKKGITLEELKRAYIEADKIK